MANHIETLIAEFGGLTKMARALGHKHVTTVQGWRKSGRIPHWRYHEILSAAEREGVSIPNGIKSELNSGEAA